MSLSQISIKRTKICNEIPNIPTKKCNLFAKNGEMTTLKYFCGTNAAFYIRNTVKKTLTLELLSHHWDDLFQQAGIPQKK